MPGQRVDDGLRAAARKRPALCMRDDPENEAESGAGDAFKRQHGMPGQPREQRARPLAAKGMPGQARSGAEHGQSETHRCERMRWKTEGVLHAGLEFRPCRDERPHEPNVAPAIVAKILRGLLDGAFEDYGGAVIERMSQRRRGMNPFQAVLRKRQASKK